MTIRNRNIRILVLFLLILLPAFFPFAHREGYLMPWHTGSAAGNTELIVLLLAVYYLLSLPYWFFVGYAFAHEIKDFRKSFLIGNIPIFVNTIGEIIYFDLLDFRQNTHPLIEYLIGSHIDKFNVMELLEGSSVTISIFMSCVCFLLAFSLGYIVQKKGLKNLILLR